MNPKELAASAALKGTNAIEWKKTFLNEFKSLKKLFGKLSIVRKTIGLSKRSGCFKQNIYLMER